MISLYDKGPFPPCPEPFNLAEHVLRAGLRDPDKTALCIVTCEGAKEWSYAQLRQAVLGTAHGFQQRGAAPGDRILMRLGNSVDFPVVYLAAIANGCIPIPTSPALTRYEVKGIMRAMQPKFVVHDPDVPCPTAEDVIAPQDLAEYRNLSPTDFHMGDPNRLGYIIYTSGTSGVPRAVGHAHRAIWARQMMFDDWYGLTSDDRVMHAGAFNWTYTLGTGLMDPWTVGATALIPAAGIKPSELPSLMRKFGAIIFAAAPGVYRQMLADRRPQKIATLRHGLSAGEKMPSAISLAWHKATKKPLLEAYGMSECSTFISHSPDTNGPSESLGRPQTGRCLAIVRDGAPVQCGEEGTIAVHRSDPGLMLGYIDAPTDTANRFSNEWFLTGDQGRMDPEGYISYLGRNDDMMNAGGFRVSPAEVENTLIELEGVTSVAVAEVAVKEGTSVIAAFYTGPAPLDEGDWRPYVSSHLARYKQPRMFIHLESLPTGPNGKISRRLLREEFEGNYGKRN